MPTHTDYCIAIGDEECEPNEGEWDQPPGWAVQEAAEQFDDDAPWCAGRELAWSLADEYP